MKSFLTRLVLIREKEQFTAYVALTHGKMKDLLPYVNYLHPEEKRVLDQYNHLRRKESYLLGRLSAKTAILALTNTDNPTSIWIDTGVFLFPIVKHPIISNIQVSISHCDALGYSVVFPEAHPMGIDVERIHADRTKAVVSQLTEKEQLLLRQQAKDTISNYTALFSIKEALSKVLRTGMMVDFKFLEVATLEEKDRVLKCKFTNFGQYQAFAYVGKKHVFSIVLPKHTKVDLTHLWRMISDNID